MRVLLKEIESTMSLDGGCSNEGTMHKRCHVFWLLGGSEQHCKKYTKLASSSLILAIAV